MNLQMLQIQKLYLFFGFHFCCARSDDIMILCPKAIISASSAVKSSLARPLKWIGLSISCLWPLSYSLADEAFSSSDIILLSLFSYKTVRQIYSQAVGVCTGINFLEKLNMSISPALSAMLPFIIRRKPPKTRREQILIKWCKAGVVPAGLLTVSRLRIPVL